MSFTVTYNGNNSDGGSVPVDSHTYNSGDPVTVLSPGGLSKTGDTFAYWSTVQNGAFSGTIYGPGAKFNITVDTVLYAQWYTTTGLPNGGVTSKGTYTFSFDSSLQAAGIEPARTIAVMGECESDFQLMSGWFNGVAFSPGVTLPYPMYVAVTSGGANTGGTGANLSTVLKMGNSTDTTLMRYLMVSEMTENFMSVQNTGWYAPDGSNEQSCGEGLSRFLAQQFLTVTGLGVIESGYAISPSWLNSSLPAGTAGSSQLGGDFTKLSAAITDTVTTIPVATTPTNPFQTAFLVQVDSEQMLVVDVSTSANTYTVKRGQNGTTKAPHADKATVQYSYGPRTDFVNVTLEYDHGIDAATGCAMLFLYYLNVQLGFSIEQIVLAAPGVANAASCLRGVYQNLTGDASDPFPFFKQLLDNAFPPDQVSNVPGPNPDNPWPLGSLSFYGAKNTWGHDEVTDLIDNPTSNGLYPDAFYLVLEGFNQKVVGSATPENPTIAFGGTTASLDLSGPGILYETTNPNIPQRIRYPYDVSFSASGLGTFPASGQSPTPAAVNTKIDILGVPIPASTEFFFLGGADPYFTNVLADPSNPTDVNVPWLSEDLRVFTATPGAPPASQYQYPVPGGPKFVEQSSQGNYDVPGAYAYLQKLLLHLNQTYGDPQGIDPFDPAQTVIPTQSGAYTGDSSVVPTTTVAGQNYNNYSFAIARVRMRGSSTAPAATGVKVFFRLWSTQTADTDFQPATTYLSNPDSMGNPLWPEAPPDDQTIPFFATSNTPNFSAAHDPEFGATGFTHTGANNLTITIRQGDSQWSYFGCFLNVNDTNNVVNGQVVPLSLTGTHHCLVAQIAYAGAPIENVGGVIETPENSDQLAQRNLQVTTSDNPGPPSTHRVPQTFDIRPSPAAYNGTAATFPDELMIEWGKIPAGSVASIYWPQVESAEVLSLASWMYGVHALSASDPHTLQCRTTKGVSYIPIPHAPDNSFAGLFTLQLPATVVDGQEFDIIVRRIATRRLDIAAGTGRSTASTNPRLRTERYIVGSFQVKIPVKTRELMLPAEETTLAIFKARLAETSPRSAWHPVLVRYIELVSGRVDGLGGNANAIPPSLHGHT